MKKLYDFEKVIFFVPFVSTTVIAVITYILLQKYKSSVRIWLNFFLTIAVSLLVVAFVNIYVMSGLFIVLNIIVSALLLSITNICLVNLQKKAEKLSAEEREIPQEAKSGNFKAFFKKHKVAIIVSGVAIYLILVFGFVGFRILYAYKTDIIKDTNGQSDYTLNTITVQEIADAKFNNYTSFFSGSSSEGEDSEINDIRLEEADYDTTVFKAKSLNGVLIANAVKTDSPKVNFKITSTLKSGNLAISVYVVDSFYCDVAVNSTEEISVENISGKTVYVKVAGEQADMSIEVLRTTG